MLKFTLMTPEGIKALIKYAETHPDIEDLLVGGNSALAVRFASKKDSDIVVSDSEMERLDEIITTDIQIYAYMCKSAGLITDEE